MILNIMFQLLDVKTAQKPQFVWFSFKVKRKFLRLIFIVAAIFYLDLILNHHAKNTFLRFILSYNFFSTISIIR